MNDLSAKFLPRAADSPDSAFDRTDDAAEQAAVALRRLIEHGDDRLPLPAHGATIQRWQVLAQIAERDLSLAKLFEAHTDALAILDELGHHPSHTAEAKAESNAEADSSVTWAVWAAEAPGLRVTFDRVDENTVRLNGSKAWCSGAHGCSHALLTAWGAEQSSPQLVSVRLADAGVRIANGPWCAVGMAGSPGLQVSFQDVRADLVGGPGDYLSRPGFWHGGAGIAACWYGGTLAIANTLRRSVHESTGPDKHPFRLLALGRIDVMLSASAALLRECAAWIDAHPTEDAAAWALRVRLATEATAQAVLDEAGRALGATAFCTDRHFARAAADLPVFVRQSHADRDYVALAGHVRNAPGWTL